MKRIQRKSAKPTATEAQPTVAPAPAADDQAATAAKTEVADEVLPLPAVNESTTETDSTTSTATANVAATPVQPVVIVNAETGADSSTSAPAPAESDDKKDWAPGQPKDKIRPLDKEAFDWIMGREIFGGVSPSMFLPIYDSFGEKWTTLGCQSIAKALGRSLTLAEVQLLVSKDGDGMCTCANPTCKKEFVPVRWTRITRDLCKAVEACGNLEKALFENPGFASGCHYLVGDQHMTFCGSPYKLDRASGKMVIAFTCNAKARDVNTKRVQGEPPKKLWGMTLARVEELTTRIQERQETQQAESSFFQNLGERLEQARPERKRFDRRDRRR